MQILKGIGIAIMLAYTSSASSLELDIEKIDQILSRKNYCGVVLIADANKIYYEKAYGYANKETSLLNTSETRFPIASITKIVTSALVQVILKEKDIDLNSSVGDYLGRQFPSELTIQSLFTHQSGLKLYTDFNQSDEKRSFPLSKNTLYELMLENPSRSLGFNYNNGNYILLEHLIEKITKHSYQHCLQEKILTPCGMAHTNTLSSTQTEGLATGYSKQGHKALPIDYLWLGGGAGIYSTAHDLYIFAKNLLGHRIISAEMLQDSFKDYGGSYGYGWTTGTISTIPVRFHEGGIDGFSTMLMLEPTTTRLLIMLSNSEIDIAELSREIFSHSKK